MSLINYKLGKAPARHDSRTLLLANYLTLSATLPSAPFFGINYSKKVTMPCGLFMNDTLGDCTCAAVCHAIQVVTANASMELTLPDTAALSMYEYSCGYKVGDSTTDKGGVCIDVLTDWINHGIGSFGHNLSAFTFVSPLNHSEVSAALNLFGFLYIGVQLPISAQSQIGSLWETDNTSAGTPNSWGGHCVIVVAEDFIGPTVITWGKLQQMSWNFWDRYVDEAYACVTPEWIEATGSAPSGFNLSALMADLKLIQ